MATLVPQLSADEDSFPEKTYLPKMGTKAAWYSSVNLSWLLLFQGQDDLPPSLVDEMIGEDKIKFKLFHFELRLWLLGFLILYLVTSQNYKHAWFLIT